MLEVRGKGSPTIPIPGRVRGAGLEISLYVGLCSNNSLVLTLYLFLSFLSSSMPSIKTLSLVSKDKQVQYVPAPNPVSLGNSLHWDILCPQHSPAQPSPVHTTHCTQSNWEQLREPAQPERRGWREWRRVRERAQGRVRELREWKSEEERERERRKAERVVEISAVSECCNVSESCNREVVTVFFRHWALLFYLRFPYSSTLDLLYCPSPNVQFTVSWYTVSLTAGLFQYHCQDIK